MMRIYCCQMDVSWEDKRANFLRARGMLRAAAIAPGALVVLPEMFATGFSMNVAAIAEPPGGETERFLCELAAELKSTVIGGLVRHAFDGKGRNAALVAGPDGKTAAEYHKMHPFTYGDEGTHYGGGDRPHIVDVQGVKVAPTICYDLRFPELYRQLAVAGAEVLVVIANWPVTRESHWLTLLQARAIENQAFVIGCNRVGRDANSTYAGHSLIVAPRGELLADAATRERILAADIDPAQVAVWRDAFPALKDIRQDLWQGRP